MSRTQDKIDFMVEEYRKNQSLRSIDLRDMIRAKFGNDTDGHSIKKAMMTVNPDYKGKKRRNKYVFSAAENGVTSMSKVKITKLYEAGSALGLTAGTIRALVLQATRKVKYVPDFTKEQLALAKERLIRTGKVCFAISKNGNLHLVNSDRVIIKDERGSNGDKKVC